MFILLPIGPFVHLSPNVIFSVYSCTYGRTGRRNYVGLTRNTCIQWICVRIPSLNLGTVNRVVLYSFLRKFAGSTEYRQTICKTDYSLEER